MLIKEVPKAFLRPRKKKKQMKFLIREINEVEGVEK